MLARQAALSPADFHSHWLKETIRQDPNVHGVLELLTVERLRSRPSSAPGVQSCAPSAPSVLSRPSRAPGIQSPPLSTAGDHSRSSSASRSQSRSTTRIPSRFERYQAEQPSKRSHKCTQYRQAGHNKRRCGELQVLCDHTGSEHGTERANSTPTTLSPPPDTQRAAHAQPLPPTRGD